MYYDLPNVLVSSQLRFERTYDYESTAQVPLPESIYDISVASFTSESETDARRQRRIPTKTRPWDEKRPVGKKDVSRLPQRIERSQTPTAIKMVLKERDGPPVLSYEEPVYDMYEERVTKLPKPRYSSDPTKGPPKASESRLFHASERTIENWNLITKPPIWPNTGPFLSESRLSNMHPILRAVTNYPSYFNGVKYQHFDGGERRVLTGVGPSTLVSDIMRTNLGGPSIDCNMQQHVLHKYN